MTVESLGEAVIVGLGGRVIVSGQQEVFNRGGGNYPRPEISLIEESLDGRIIFAAGMNQIQALQLSKGSGFEKAILAKKLELFAPKTRWFSLEVKDVGSIFLSADFVASQYQDGLVAMAVAFGEPFGVIREYQVNPSTHQESFVSWSVVRLDDAAIRTYVASVKMCETGRPMRRFEVFELGPPNDLLRSELLTWCGVRAVSYEEPFLDMQPNQIALIILR